ncbi:MAG: polysaccharide pyruvyl transferase family protein, partial [Litorimonas sp.]
VVGTRLHGGIRGLMHGRRVLVTQIDNRARDIGLETGLPTCARDMPVDALAARLGAGFATEMNLPVAEIERFLGQFRV